MTLQKYPHRFSRSVVAALGAHLVLAWLAVSLPVSLEPPAPAPLAPVVDVELELVSWPLEDNAPDTSAGPARPTDTTAEPPVRSKDRLSPDPVSAKPSTAAPQLPSEEPPSAAPASQMHQVSEGVSNQAPAAAPVRKTAQVNEGAAKQLPARSPTDLPGADLPSQATVEGPASKVLPGSEKNSKQPVANRLAQRPGVPPNSGLPSQATGPAVETGTSLSLAQLGMERGNPLVLPPPTAAPSPGVLTQQRLERSLVSALHQQDAKVGLGAEGPVVSAMIMAATGVASPRGKARVVVRTDDDGKVSNIELASFSGDGVMWRKVIERVLARLGKKPLRTPKGYGVALTLDIVSKVQLPSGREPGPGVSVFGIPLNGRKNGQPAQVELLKPKVSLKTVEVSDGSGQSLKLPVPSVEVVLLGVNLDLSDIGAQARQVIHVEVVNQELL